MKRQATLTALALVLALAAAPALAQQAVDGARAPAAQAPAEGVIEKAGDAIRDAAESIEAFLVGKDGAAEGGKLEPVLIRRDATARGMLGADVLDQSGKKISKVEDIIIGEDGRALSVVVSDGGVLGIGEKVAAFDYGRVARQNPDGSVVMRLTQDMIGRAADFSYDPDDREGAKVIPPNAVSVRDLLDAEVLDPRGEKLAEVENLSFTQGDAAKIIVGFNKTLGMGGDLAALGFDDAKMARKGRDIDFTLNADQAARFNAFKQSVRN